MKKVLRGGRAKALCGAAAAVLLAACGDPVETEPQPQTGCPPGTVAVEGGKCEEAGLPPRDSKACEPGTWAPVEGGACQPAGLPAEMPACPPGESPGADGACAPAGVPEGACGEGFSASNGGCEPVLPEVACPAGQLAIPGEKDCHEVAPCGDAPYGDAPVGADTQFVDGSYAGGDSDGSAAKPWTTVQAGIDAAAPGAVVAVAAGTYAEEAAIGDKAVRLWGRCPSLVTIEGVGTALTVTGGAGSEVHGIGITGAGRGIRLVSAQNVSLRRVWVHGTGAEGIVVTKGLDPSVGVEIEGSLVEDATVAGIAVQRSSAAIRRSAVRGTLNPGFGVVVTSSTPEDVADVSIERSVIERNDYDGVQTLGSKLSVDSTVLRANTNAELYAGNAGHLRSSVTVSKSVVEQADQAGLYAIGSDLTVTDSVVRDDVSQHGWGIYLDRDKAVSESATGTITGCLVAGNHGTAIAAYGSKADVSATIVRDTQMETLAGHRINGVGISAIGGKDGGDERASVSVTGSEVANSHLTGVLVVGSDATIAGTKITGTIGILDKGDAFFAGAGVEADDDAVTGRSSLTISSSLLADNHQAGATVSGSDATIESTEIRGTLSQPLDGQFGRGIQVQAGIAGARSNVTVRASVVKDNQDVGVFVGGSDALLEGVIVQGTKPPEVEPSFGTGVNAELDAAVQQRADVTLRGSVIAENRAVGLIVRGATAIVEDTVVRDTLPEADTQLWGRGVLALPEETTGSAGDLTLRWSRVENNSGMGVGVYGSFAQIEATEIRGTQPNPGDESHGDGLQVWDHAKSGNRATAIVKRSWIVGNHETGVLVGGDVTLSGVRVEGTLPEESSGYFGRGVSAEYEADTKRRANLVMEDCHVLGNRDVGIFAAGADVKISHTLVESTTPREKDGLFGDGVVAMAYQEPASVSLSGSLITASQRAGLANFGSEVSVESTKIQCSGFDLEADAYDGQSPSLKDLGENLCGCPKAEEVCHAESSALAAPDHQDVSTPPNPPQ